MMAARGEEGEGLGKMGEGKEKIQSASYGMNVTGIKRKE